MTVSVPTSGQVERSLAQRIQSLYRDQLGHRTGKVTCQLFDSKVAIVIEDSITQPEQLLAQGGKEELVEQFRLDLAQAIQPQVKEIIEEILQVQVLDLLSDATLETGRTGIIAILDGAPSVRNPNTIPKTKIKSTRLSKAS
jgi:uncharacterized protein YbcI